MPELLTESNAFLTWPRPRRVGRLVALSARLMAVTVLGLAFFLAPALQGINLEADQSAGVTPATRAADEAAAREALRLASN